MRPFSFLLLSFFYLTMQIVHAQNTVITFDVMYDGKAIGTLTASKEVKGTTTIKNLHNTTDAKILKLNEYVESEVQVKSEGEILTSATTYRNSNRKAEDIEATTVRGEGNTYDIVKNGEKVQLTHVGIKCCVTDLYFAEPLGCTKVYSNAYANFLNLRYLSKGSYMITMPDGKTSTFNYADGKLTEAITTTSSGSIVFKRK